MVGLRSALLLECKAVAIKLMLDKRWKSGRHLPTMAAGPHIQQPRLSTPKHSQSPPRLHTPSSTPRTIVFPRRPHMLLVGGKSVDVYTRGPDDSYVDDEFFLVLVSAFEISKC